MSQTAQTSTRDALWAGCRDAVGVPAAVLVAGMIGFGALGHASGLSIGLTTATSFFIYALPGQVVFVEMVALGASGFAVALAAALTAARFLPMTLTLVPQIPKEDRRRSLYASWAVMMRDFAHIQASQRMAYFTGFGMTCWAVSTPATMLGYLLAGHVPTPVTIGLVMLNPLFFLLSFTEVRARASRLALLIGGLSGPIVYGWAPGWSILICGLIGGTAAFFLDVALGKKN
jgi:predicted branched-subunit amino acid permease